MVLPLCCNNSRGRVFLIAEDEAQCKDIPIDPRLNSRFTTYSKGIMNDLKDLVTAGFGEIEGATNDEMDSYIDDLHVKVLVQWYWKIEQSRDADPVLVDDGALSSFYFNLLKGMLGDNGTIDDEDLLPAIQDVLTCRFKLMEAAYKHHQTMAYDGVGRADAIVNMRKKIQSFDSGGNTDSAGSKLVDVATAPQLFRIIRYNYALVFGTTHRSAGTEQLDFFDVNKLLRILFICHVLTGGGYMFYEKDEKVRMLSPFDTVALQYWYKECYNHDVKYVLKYVNPETAESKRIKANYFAEKKNLQKKYKRKQKNWEEILKMKEEGTLVLTAGVKLRSLPDGCFADGTTIEDAKYPIGTSFRKKFFGKWYSGKVAHITKACMDKQLMFLYKVAYEDDDEEELEESELDQLVERGRDNIDIDSIPERSSRRRYGRNVPVHDNDTNGSSDDDDVDDEDFAPVFSADDSVGNRVTSLKANTRTHKRRKVSAERGSGEGNGICKECGQILPGSGQASSQGVDIEI